jgi:hypothetical protein
MLGGQINNAGRAMEGYLARWFRDTNASIASSGSSNAYVVTSSRTITSLTDGLTMAFRANHANTGAATLNLNTLGAKAIKRFNGNALASGDIVSGQPVQVFYSLSLDEWFMVSAPAALTGNMFVDLEEGSTPSVPAAGDRRLFAHTDGYVGAIDDAGFLSLMWPPATKTVMEAGTSSAHTVTPEMQHHHPGHPKATGRAASGGGITGASYNVASIVRNSTGQYTVTLTNAMADTDYWVVATLTNSGAADRFALVQITSSSTFVLRAFDVSSAGTVDMDIGFAVFGEAA